MRPCAHCPYSSLCLAEGFDTMLNRLLAREATRLRLEKGYRRRGKRRDGERAEEAKEIVDRLLSKRAPGCPKELY